MLRCLKKVIIACTRSFLVLLGQIGKYFEILALANQNAFFYLGACCVSDSNLSSRHR
jgi:hypothetical protein